MSCPRGKEEGKAMIRNQHNYFLSSDQDAKQDKRMHRKQCQYTKLTNNKSQVGSFFPPKNAKRQSKIKLKHQDIHVHAKTYNDNNKPQIETPPWRRV